MIPLSRPLLALLVAAPLPAVAANPATPSNTPRAWTHPGAEMIRDNGYDGPETCSTCHPDALSEVTHTVHWYAAGAIRNVRGLPDGSWWGMVNRECALAGTTALANWTAATDSHFTAQAAGCGMCHIASLTAPPLPPGRDATPAEAATVDCLVCHAGRYDMATRKTLVTDDNGSTHWGQDRSVAAALSITRTPPAAACLRCHEHSFSRDYKRGTPYEPSNDVHAAAGIPCTSCHTTRQHRIAAGQFESDMVANDLPDEAVACSNCHGSTPHRGPGAAVINDHGSVIACQTCHIPAVSGIVREDWGKPVKDDGSGSFSELSWFDAIPAVAGAWVPTVTIARDHPDYMWRVPNLADTAGAQSWMAFATASRTTDGATLYPVRALTQILLFDPQVKMWQAPGMSFLKDRPETANLPLLLAPNREVYNSTGDIGAAIAAGMKPAEAMGLTRSGQWMSMQVPGTSYISVNHGVKRMGLSCRDCHSPHGVLDFTALGYSDDEAQALRRPRE